MQLEQLTRRLDAEGRAVLEGALKLHHGKSASRALLWEARSSAEPDRFLDVLLAVEATGDGEGIALDGLDFLNPPARRRFLERARRWSCPQLARSVERALAAGRSYEEGEHHSLLAMAGETRARGALGSLMEVAWDEGAPAANREAAVRAAGMIADRGVWRREVAAGRCDKTGVVVQPFVHEALECADDPAAADAVAALGREGDEGLRDALRAVVSDWESDPSRFVPLLDGSPVQLGLAILGCLRADPGRALTALARRLTEVDDAELIPILNRLPAGSSSGEALRELLAGRDRPEPVLVAAARRAGDLRCETLAPLILQCLNGGGPALRAAAALALGALGSEEAGEELRVHATADLDPGVRRAAVTALAGMGDADALVIAAADPDPEVALRAILGLRGKQAAMGIPALLAAAARDEARLAQAALEVLGVHPNVGARTDALLVASERRIDGALLEALQRTLDAAPRELGGRLELVADLAERALGRECASLRHHAIRLLGCLPADERLARLARALAAESERARATPPAAPPVQVQMQSAAPPRPLPERGSGDPSEKEKPPPPPGEFMIRDNLMALWGQIEVAMQMASAAARTQLTAGGHRDRSYVSYPDYFGPPVEKRLPGGDDR